MSHRSNRNEALLAKYLYNAVESTDIRQVFVILRERRANPNFILDSNGISPFHFVIGNESKKFAYEATKLMLLYGADPNVRSEDKVTPVHIATAWNRAAILHQLLKAGGDPFLRDDEDKSAVDYALEGGLTKALQIINYHTTQRIPPKKVYLYRDDVRAEYSARPAVDSTKRNRHQEEVFQYPENWSSSEGSSSEVSITHRITIPSDGNIRIESSVNSDNEKTVKHQYELADSNIKRTIMTYLKDCQVYECVVPGDGNSPRSAPSLKENRTPERSIRSHSSTPNRKTPSSVNFSSLCNNLAKELHEKLKPPQVTASGLNVLNENRDLYTTCLADPQEVEIVASCSKNANLESNSSLQKYPRKCVRNIFINECNTNKNSPSRSLTNQNVPFSLAQKSVCKNCEEILCNNFKIVCYHFCDSHNPTNCSGNLHNNTPPENLSDVEVCCKNNQKNLFGFEGIEQEERPRTPLKAVPSPNQVRSAPALPIGFVVGDFRRKSVDCCDGAAKIDSDKASSTPNKKVKSKPNSNFLKNRAKLEKAFLNCIRKSQVSDESPEKGGMYSQAAETSVILNHSLDLNKSSSPVQESRPKSLSNCAAKIHEALNEMGEHSDAANSSYSSSVVNDSYQSLNVDVVNNESSGDHKIVDPSSPKRCNICDYNDHSNDIDTSQIKVSPLFLSCHSIACSESKKNRLSLPVSSSPVKSSEKCVELHIVPDAKSDDGSEKEISPALDNLNKSSSTFETVIKVSSNESISSQNEVESNIDPVVSPSSVESLTNISDLLSNSPENPCKMSFDEEKESNPTSCLNVAFCVDSGTVENTVVGIQSNGRDSNSMRRLELSSNQSEHSDAFFSSSERCSPVANKLALNENLRDIVNFPESSSDYFSPNELTRSYFTSDEEPSFLAPIACKRVKNPGTISTEQCDSRLQSARKTECDYGAALMTSDDEPAPKSEPEFNVCEEYKYVDKEQDIVFRETRFKSSTVRLSALNGFENLSLTENGRKTHKLSDDESSETASSVGSLSYDTDALRLKLKQKGYVPGPITFTTKRLYLRKLKKINRKKAEAATDSGVNAQNPDSFSQEADRTINLTDDKEWQNLLQSWSALETKMSSYFETPTRHAKWRGGIAKCSFTYLLLDPRVTDNLPVRSQGMSSMAVWSTFLKAIFYIGKGKRSRPYSHLYEAVKFWNDGTSSSSEKIQHILTLWKSNHGVVCLNVFQNIMPVEALTREAAMIEALGLQNLKNERHGEYYGPCASWSMKLKCQLGCFLLYRALIVFLADGERQLKPYDVE